MPGETAWRLAHAKVLCSGGRRHGHARRPKVLLLQGGWSSRRPRINVAPATEAPQPPTQRCRRRRLTQLQGSGRLRSDANDRWCCHGARKANDEQRTRSTPTPALKRPLTPRPRPPPRGRLWNRHRRPGLGEPRMTKSKKSPAAFTTGTRRATRPIAGATSDQAGITTPPPAVSARAGWRLPARACVRRRSSSSSRRESRGKRTAMCSCSSEPADVRRSLVARPRFP